MWSKSRRLFRRVQQAVQNMRISLKITLVYAAVLGCILTLTNIITIAGIYFSLSHQAEIDMKISMSHVLQEIENGAPFDPGLLHEDPLMPGVVLRVADSEGRIVFDNAMHYPSIPLVESHLEQNPPFWANQTLKVARLRNLSLYYDKIDVLRQGKPYTLYFMKTITAENHFLNMLRNCLMITNLLGIVIALLAGYFLSRRVLRPIRTLTQAARKIEITDLGQRIDMPAAHDELSELASTFNHMLDRIQSGFEQQRRFVSDASHELRTPVTVIRGYSDLLSRWGREDPAALDEGIAAIRSEAEDMQALIEKLLFLARADQKRQVLHKETLSMQGLVEDVVKKLQLIDHRHDIVLLENEPAEIFADPVTIKQMLRIFLENSMKYTPEGGIITVSSVKEDADLLVTLADTGIGIAPEHQAKVFERFYRVDSSRTKGKEGAGGTGLGLSIARWIAEQHSIRITLESALGQGTSIRLFIPLAESSNLLADD